MATTSQKARLIESVATIQAAADVLQGFAKLAPFAAQMRNDLHSIAKVNQPNLVGIDAAELPSTRLVQDMLDSVGKAKEVGKSLVKLAKNWRAKLSTWQKDKANAKLGPEVKAAGVGTHLLYLAGMAAATVAAIGGADKVSKNAFNSPSFNTALAVLGGFWLWRNASAK